MRALIAIEDSIFGEAIADFVVNHDWPKSVEFKVLHVVDFGLLTNPSDIAYAEMLDNFIKDSWSEGDRLVSRVAEKLRSAIPGVQVEEEVVEGPAKEKIIEIAQDWKANIIFVGSHGRKGFDRFLMGSVSTAVVSHAPCSVMVVRLGKKKELEIKDSAEAVLEEAGQ